MTKHLLLTVTAIIAFTFSYAQSGRVGIGTSNPEQKLDVAGSAKANDKVIGTRGFVAGSVTADTAKAIFSTDVTNKGFYIPRLTTAQKTTLGGTLNGTNKGLLVFDTDLNRTDFWDGSAWKAVGDGAGGPPTGNAGGDLTGTYPNPTIANDKVTSNKILDGTITSADLATPAVNAANQIFNTLPVGNGGTGVNTVTGVVIGNGGSPVSGLAASAGNQVLRRNNANNAYEFAQVQYSDVSGTPSSLPPSGTAGGDLTGTYPNPTIANNAVTIAKLPTGATSTTFLRGDGTWVTPTDNNTTYSAGTGLNLSGYTFNLSNTGTAGTYTKVTTNAQGQVTGGTTLAASDIPDLSGDYVNRTTNQTAAGNKTWTGTTTFNADAVAASGAQFYNNQTGVSQILFNSTGANWGNIQNDASGVWSLGYGATGTNALKTPVLSWNSSNNVGIGTINPLSKLSVGGTGNANYAGYFIKTAGNGTAAIFAEGGTPTSAYWAGGINATVVSGGGGYAYGIMGSSTGGSGASGRAYGVYGKAGGGTSGWNYGTTGELLSSAGDGAGIYGVDRNAVATTSQISGKYAGYFDGKVNVNGTIGINGGSPAAGYVLTSTDASGNATWTSPNALGTKRQIPDPGASAAWYKLGTWTTDQTYGARITFTVTGSAGYNPNDVSSTGKTVININTANNSITNSSNVNGYFYTEGGMPAILEVKCKQGANSRIWEVYAKINYYVGNSFMEYTEGLNSTWAYSLSAASDPGAASGTIKVLDNRMSITGGNVGIGTANPITTLDVNGVANISGGGIVGTAAPLIFTGTGSGTYNKTVIYNDLTKGLYFDLARGTDNISATPIDFHIDARGGGKNFFHIAGNTGNVGIGAASSGAKLHVEGTISSSTWPAFNVYNNTGGDQSTTGTYNATVKLFDNGNNFNLSTDEFTAPVKGIYQFNWTAYSNGLTGRVFLYVNGNVNMQTNGNAKSISITLLLNANDKVKLGGDPSYPMTWYGNFAHNAFSGHLVMGLP